MSGPPVCARWIWRGAGSGSAATQSAEQALTNNGMTSWPDTCSEIQAWRNSTASKRRLQTLHVWMAVAPRTPGSRSSRSMPSAAVGAARSPGNDGRDLTLP
jgi:hypothetical protein